MLRRRGYLFEASEIGDKTFSNLVMRLDDHLQRSFGLMKQIDELFVSQIQGDKLTPEQKERAKKAQEFMKRIMKAHVSSWKALADFRERYSVSFDEFMGK